MIRFGARRLSSLVVAAMVAVGLAATVAACGGSDAPEVQTPPLDLETVSVLTTGTGSGVDLRWAPEVGERAHFDVSIGVETEVELDELTQQATIGPATVGYDAEVVAVDADGVITTEYTVTAAGVEDGGDDGLDEALQRLVGTTIVDRVSARGVPQMRTVETPAPLGAAEQAQLDRFVAQLAFVFAPLPEEPVGEGATWVYASEVEVQGVTWTRTSTFELTSTPDTAVDIDVDLADYAEFQQVDQSGPTNLEGTVVGSGALTADLTSLDNRRYSSSTELEAAIFTGEDRTGRTANRTDTALTSLDSDP